MSTPVTFNGVVYPIPVTGDLNWGPNATRIWVALASYSLSPSGGLFTLTNDVNLGPSFGLLGAYFGGRGTIASSGLLRLSKTDTVAWKNNGGSGNNLLAVDSSDNITWNGTPLSVGLQNLPNGDIWIGSSGNLPVAQALTGDITVTNAGVTSIGADKITNSQVNSAAGIVYSKLTLTGSITNTDIDSSASIAYSKLALSNSITNTDIANGASIAYLKLNLGGSITNLDIHSSAGIAYAKLNLGNSLLNADINASAAIAVSKLAALTASSPVRSDGSGFLTTGATDLSTSDVTGNLGVTHLNSGTAASSGTFWRGDGTWAAVAGTGTVNSGTAGQLTYYATSTNAVSGLSPLNYSLVGGTSDLLTLGGSSTNAVSYILKSNSLSTQLGADSSGNFVLKDVDNARNILLYTRATPLVTLATQLDMGTHKIVSVSDGTAATDAATFGQIYYGFQAAIQATTSSQTTSTSNAFANTNLAGTITPTSSSHRIKVTVTSTLQVNSATAVGHVTLKRGSTDLSSGSAGFAVVRNGSVATQNGAGTTSFVYIDSPATTSATTYTVAIRNDDNATLVADCAGSTEVIILEEIV